MLAKAAAGLPELRFRRAHADEHHQQHRQRRHHERPRPAECRQDQATGGGGQHDTDEDAAVEHRAPGAAPCGADRLGHQGLSDAIFTPDADACDHGEEDHVGEVRREGPGQRTDAVLQDAQLQRPFPPKPVAQVAPEHPSDCDGGKLRREDGRDLHRRPAKGPRHRDDHKREEIDLEVVEHPAQIGAEERPPRRGGVDRRCGGASGSSHPGV